MRRENLRFTLAKLEHLCYITIPSPNIFICSSDQGTEFMAEAITSMLAECGTNISASDLVSPWQNGYLTLTCNVR
jgi:hypothetical protein